MKTIKEIFRSWGVVDAEGRHVNGTDKETNHSYGDAYERVIDNTFGIGCDSRRHVRLMMEVGVADGSSLCAWRDIFPNAICVGMDIHHSDKAHGERIEFHFGDQRNKEHCDRAAAGRLFDMIVEDALHDVGATLLTLFYLWPYVAPGGLYVVEEFAQVHELQRNIAKLFPFAEIVNTPCPFGGNEPLVVLRKPR